jgi:hypothetical protein
MDKETALFALRDCGVPFDEKSALAYVAKGDARTLELLLAAGINPDCTDDTGTAALTIAGRKEHADVCRILLAFGAKPASLVDALDPLKRPSKDLWERLTASSGMLTFVSSLMIAGVGWYFTNTYNIRQSDNAQRQADRDVEIRKQQTRIAEMDTVVKMIPQLTQSEQSKRAALLALSSLATPELATQMAQLFGGIGAVQALDTIAAQNSSVVTPSAVSALAGIATQPGTEGAAAATIALAGIFQGKERGLVGIHSRNRLSCSGFITGSTPLVVTPRYCVADTHVGDLTIRTSDNNVLPVLSIDTNSGPVAVIRAKDLSRKDSLALAGELPSIGSRVMEIGYVGSDARFSVAAGIVEGLVERQDPSISKGQQPSRLNLLAVRVLGEKRLGGGSAGGPILDSFGSVSCMIYLGEPEGIEYCLPSEIIRRSLEPMDAGGRPGTIARGVIVDERNGHLYLDVQPCNAKFVSFSSPYRKTKVGSVMCGSNEHDVYEVSQSSVKP